MKKTAYLGFLLVIASLGVFAQTAEPDPNTNDSAAIATKQLASRDPFVRQHGAEELARLEATDQRRVVEGYRLQETNGRVKLALEWALYRMGKSDSLFPLVKALDTSREDQSSSYLMTLDDPKPLHFFLERMNGVTQAKLIEVLAKVGDAESLERVRPFKQSYDPKIASAARYAEREIESRLAQAPTDRSTRPRRTIEETTQP